MWLQVLSMIGALMVLAAYGLNQGGVWNELHTGYLALNIVGSLLLGVVAIVDQRAGFIVLEFAWAGLGLVGGCVLQSKTRSRPTPRKVPCFTS